MNGVCMYRLVLWQVTECGGCLCSNTTPSRWLTASWLTLTTSASTVGTCLPAAHHIPLKSLFEVVSVWWPLLSWQLWWRMHSGGVSQGICHSSSLGSSGHRWSDEQQRWNSLLEERHVWKTNAHAGGVRRKSGPWWLRMWETKRFHTQDMYERYAEEQFNIKATNTQTCLVQQVGWNCGL